jgi:hypothetical protein
MLVVLAVLLGAVAWAGGHWTGGPVGRSTAGGDTASTRTGGASTGGVHDPRPAAASPAASAEPSSPGGAPASADPASADEREQPATVRGWQELVGELYGRRARAFATGDAGSLGGVYVPGSAALAADVQALGALQAEHRLVRGFAPVVDEVTGVSAADGRVQLRLVDRWPGYDVVAANAPDGPALATAAPHAPAAATMVLVRTAAGWRVDSVTREPP